ncbi:MAG: TolB family protein [Thermomicrobiales bacterium]
MTRRTRRSRPAWRSCAAILFARDGALYVVGSDLTDERLISDEVSASFPTWSPDRSRIAFFSPEPDDYTGRSRLFLVGADGSDLTLLAEDVMPEIWPIWSPDGSHIAITGYAEQRNTGRRREPTVIRVVEAATGQITTVTGADMPYVQSPAWSPTADRLAFVSMGDRGRGDGPAYRMEGDVYVLDLASRELTNATNGRLTHAERVTWSPVAAQLLIYSQDRGTPWYESALTSVALFDLATDTIEEMDNQTRDLGLPYWSPDGRAFAFTEGDQTVRIRWLTGDEVAVVVSRTVASIVTWSPDGSALILVANDPKQASFLVPLDGDTFDATTEISLHFDLANPWLGPPQWSPVDPADLPGPPSVSGTGLDASR